MSELQLCVLCHKRPVEVDEWCMICLYFESFHEVILEELSGAERDEIIKDYEWLRSKITDEDELKRALYAFCKIIEEYGRRVEIDKAREICRQYDIEKFVDVLMSQFVVK